MKLKNIPQELISRFKTYIIDWAQSKNISVSLDRKIAKWNDLANKNKTQTTIITIGALLLLLIIHIFFLTKKPTKEDQFFTFKDIPDISSLMLSAQQIENTKQYQANSIKTIVFQGQKIKVELDSLLSIPNKSHEDSLNIIRKHKQLTHIANYINDEKD